MSGAKESRDANGLHYPSDLIAVACVAVCVLYGAATIPLSFNTNDDVTMSGIARGLFGNVPGEPRLIHQSAFLGLVIGGLFKAAPSVDWYSIFHWATTLLCLLAIGIVWLRRDTSLLSISALLAISTIFFSPIVFHIQFTQTSVVALTAALILLLDDYDSPPGFSRRHGLIVGLVVTSAWIRPANTILAPAVILGVSIVLISWTASIHGRAACLRNLVTCLSVVLASTLLIWGSSTLEHRLFYADPEWQSFWRHNSDRAYVMHNWPRDLGLARVALAIEKEMNLPVVTYDAITHWIPVDSQTYSGPTFSEMARVIRGLERPSADGLDRFTESIATFSAWIERVPILLHGCGFIVILAVCYAARHHATAALALANGSYWLAFLLALLWGIQITYRTPPYRVWMPLLALVATCSAFSLALMTGGSAIPPVRTARARLTSAVLLVTFLGAVGWLAPLHSDFRERLSKVAHRRAQECSLADAHIEPLESLPKDGTIYLATHVIKSTCFVRPMNFSYPDVLRDRTLSFSWRNLTPSSRNRLFADGPDLFDNICSNPSNVLVMNPFEIPILERYLRVEKPEYRFVRHSSAMLPSILRCTTRSMAGMAQKRQHS